MKVKVIARSEEEFTRERKQDVQKVFRNLDPALHPMERAREYTSALNAAKLDKVFAKPFMGALAGHVDSISCMAKNPRHLNSLATASMAGEVYLWDVAFRRIARKFVGHQRAVRGLSMSADGESLLSCGDDCTVRLWQLPTAGVGGTTAAEDHEAVAVFQGKNAFRAVDHRWEGTTFATAGAQVDIWEHERSEPINSFSWGADSVYAVRFNPSEPDIFASAASDRSIALYDLRVGTPLRKLVMQTKSNAVAWNPREAFNFTVANEDCNCYSYDMRKLKYATCVHQDHVSAVMDLDYSPTGREFVTGSYDRTVRIFGYNESRSRDVYHTKRMQRVFCVRFSGDGTYLLSGSDDTNVRIWKANASEQLGVLLPRERRKQAYLNAVKRRYSNLPDVKRIDRHHHVPKPIYKARKLRQTQQDAEKKKESHRRAHSAPGLVPHSSIRKKRIVGEVE